jgi:hypothetical protein
MVIHGEKVYENAKMFCEREVPRGLLVAVENHHAVEHAHTLSTTPTIVLVKTSPPSVRSNAKMHCWEVDEPCCGASEKNSLLLLISISCGKAGP